MTNVNANTSSFQKAKYNLHTEADNKHFPVSSAWRNSIQASIGVGLILSASAFKACHKIQRYAERRICAELISNPVTTVNVTYK